MDTYLQCSGDICLLQPVALKRQHERICLENGPSPCSPDDSRDIKRPTDPSCIIVLEPAILLSTHQSHKYGIPSTNLSVMVAKNSGPRLKEPKVLIKFSKMVAIEPRMASFSSEPNRERIVECCYKMCFEVEIGNCKVDCLRYLQLL